MSIEDAEKEWQEIIKWVIEEEDRVTAQLKSTGRYIGGLDTNQDAYRPIYIERNRRLAELKKKYVKDLELK